jgi:hypothetical protein
MYRVKFHSLSLSLSLSLSHTHTHTHTQFLKSSLFGPFPNTYSGNFWDTDVAMSIIISYVNNNFP